MMMDDERNIREYNEARKKCICANKIGCTLKIPIGGNTKCLPDKHKSCPLFVFFKSIQKKPHDNIG